MDGTFNHVLCTENSFLKRLNLPSRAVNPSKKVIHPIGSSCPSKFMIPTQILQNVTTSNIPDLNTHIIQFNIQNVIPH